MAALLHGHAKRGNISSEWRIWSAMRARCLNKNFHAYSDYGGRGIKICEEWENFEVFLKDMGKRPSKNHSLDRKDNDGDYTPDNCKWATPYEQQNNTRKTTFVTYKGKRMSLSDACKLAGIPKNTVKSRIRLGWSEQKALEPRHV